MSRGVGTQLLQLISRPCFARTKAGKLVWAGGHRIQDSRTRLPLIEPPFPSKYASMDPVCPSSGAETHFCQHLYLSVCEEPFEGVPWRRAIEEKECSAYIGRCNDVPAPFRWQYDVHIRTNLFQCHNGDRNLISLFVWLPEIGRENTWVLLGLEDYVDKATTLSLTFVLHQSDATWESRGLRRTKVPESFINVREKVI